MKTAPANSRFNSRRFALALLSLATAANALSTTALAGSMDFPSSSAATASSQPAAQSTYTASPDSSSPVGLQVARTQALESLKLAQAQSSQAMIKGQHWNFPLYMGANYVSQYYLLRSWFAAGTAEFKELKLQDFPEAELKKLLVSTQLADGSWQPTPDPNLSTGNLDATIMNYWALKVMGLGESHNTLSRAKTFILSHGGLDKSSAFTRIVLAMFTQMSWKKVPWAPMFFVNPNNPSFINVEQFPQWVRPHIVPISYLRSMHVSRDLGARFSISELNLKPVDQTALVRERNGSIPTVDQRWIINEMLKAQTKLGSWGGYTSATLFSLAAMSDYQDRAKDSAETPSIVSAATRGFHFIDKLYLDPNHPAPLMGTVCDGRYWDTILVLQGLLSSNASSESAHTDAAVGYLTQAQRENGGIPFGLEFETTPDIDDTAELITTLRLRGSAKANAAADHASAWIVSMQNSNGGWGAFDRNNTGNILLRTFTSGLKDSATLFDPSTPDVTGHALEALGAGGANINNSLTVRNAVKYLRAQVNSLYGIWPGRWGVNYIYGTNAVVSGLLRVGVSPHDPLVELAVSWMMNHQNPDGGFGETTKSDLDDRLAGQGVSTPSQTAWGLMMLVRTGHANDLVSLRAANYLNQEIKKNGKWIDTSVNGTGHSGIVYLMYPSYPLAFPMIALGEFLHATAN